MGPHAFLLVGGCLRQASGFGLATFSGSVTPLLPQTAGQICCGGVFCSRHIRAVVVIPRSIRELAPSDPVDNSVGHYFPQGTVP